MDTQEPLLKIQFDGEAVGPGRIPVSHLIRFLSCLNKTLQRTGRVLGGDSAGQGRTLKSVKAEVALDLVLLTQGSPAAVLGFERRKDAASLPQLDFGLEILESSIAGLEEVQKHGNDTGLPKGYDAGVLMAWRDAGVLFSRGVARIEITLNHRAPPLTAHFTPVGYERIQQRIKGPQTNIRTIEGRLLMADFKEHGTRCRVHPSMGDPILCLFEEDQKEEVLEDILQYVRVIGEAREDPLTGKVTSIRIHDIERLEDRDDAVELLPQGTPVSRGFWESPTLDELAVAQSVSPLSDVRALFGTWPGGDDDGFESAVDDLRHRALGGVNP